MTVFSTPEQLKEITKILSRYIRLPFSVETIPGSIMEAVLGHVKNAEVLNTYDFVDVIDRKNKVGWQVKSTKASTPVTWKRAKISNSFQLIEASKTGDAELQALGTAIIDFCNSHAHESLQKFDLKEIGYCRLIVFPNGEVTYFERKLCDRENPDIFKAQDFAWSWSKQKTTTKKEQLSALHGTHLPTNKKWWAWHGLGENQLHFSGEGNWWPQSDNPQAASFRFPSEEQRLSLTDFMALLEEIDVSEFES